MRSIRGLLAVIAFLVLMPLTVVNSALFGIEAEITVHFVAAVGFLLLALAVFDFRTPKWISWAACAAASISAVTYFLQGVSNLLPNNTALFYLAFTVLGQQLERVLPDVLILWFVALLLTDSRGKSRILGFAVMLPIVGVELVAYGALLFGVSIYDAVPLLRAALLLPFVWLPFESVKQPSADLEKPVLLRPWVASA
jgi:hypothetical protein